MDESSSLVVKRGFISNDEPFIYATWRNSRFYGTELKKSPDSKREFKKLTEEIKRILRTAHVVVACMQDTPQIIIGYAVITGSHLHWVYVKDDYRKSGIATMLVPKTIDSYTEHLTKIGRAILENKRELLAETIKENEEWQDQSNQIKP